MDLREEPDGYITGTVKKPGRLEWGESGRELLFQIQHLKEELLKYNNPIIHDYTSIFIHQKVLTLYVFPYSPTYSPSHACTCLALSAPCCCCWCWFSIISLLNYIGRVLCFIKLNMEHLAPCLLPECYTHFILIVRPEGKCPLPFENVEEDVR